MEALGYGESPTAQQALGQLDAQDQQAALMRQGDQAMSRGAHETAINSYQAALEVAASTTELTSKLNRARVARLLADADAALAAGRLAEATTSYDQALAIDPQNASAQRGAQEAARGSQYQQLLKAGDAAFAQKRFGEALRAYHSAREQINTQQVQTKLDDVEFAQLIALARGALSSQDYTSAKAYLITARRNRSSPVIDELMQLAEQETGGDGS